MLLPLFPQEATWPPFAWHLPTFRKKWGGVAGGWFKKKVAIDWQSGTPTWAQGNLPTVQRWDPKMSWGLGT